jgi:hypothetical protein
MNRRAAGGVRNGATRRAWLTGALGLGLSWLGRGGMAADDAEEVVRRRAAKAGLTGLGTSRTDHYLAIGDAPARFREEALELCEKLLGSYQKYFQNKQFEIKQPARRMTVVVLAGRVSYAAYKGEPVGSEEAGLYEIDTDQLVIFDARGPGGPAGGLQGVDPRSMNTFSLVHEAIHQLTYDTGLLTRGGDVPLAVTEGLATYGELWSKTHPVIGVFNRLRLQVLGQAGTEWIPVAKLLTDDEVFSNVGTVQAAYAEAWLLTHMLMKNRSAKFRAYLGLIRHRTDARHRADDATQALGDLDRLDRDLKKTARNLL